MISFRYILMIVLSLPAIFLMLQIFINIGLRKVVDNKIEHKSIQYNPANIESPLFFNEYAGNINTVSEMPAVDIIFYKKVSIETAFNTKNDLYSFAHKLLIKAKSGEPDSQYFLAKILVTCSGAINLVNRQRANYESNLELELVDWLANRCSSFNLDNLTEFGDSSDWIKKSAENLYAPAVIAELLSSSEIPKSTQTLNKLQNSLHSHDSEVMSLISDLPKSVLIRNAWLLLSCDFGFDCSKHSKETWRFKLAAECSIAELVGDYCDPYIDFKSYLESSVSITDYNEILKTKEHFKNLLVKNKLDEFRIEDFLN